MSVKQVQYHMYYHYVLWNAIRHTCRVQRKAKYSNVFINAFSFCHTNKNPSPAKLHHFLDDAFNKVSFFLQVNVWIGVEDFLQKHFHGHFPQIRFFHNLDDSRFQIFVLVSKYIISISIFHTIICHLQTLYYRDAALI